MSNIRVRSRLSITDLNDQISGATAPSNPEEKSLWLDTSVSPPILKYWDGSTWIPQRLDISELDPDLSITIETIEATMGNMANDNILDIKERGIVVDNINEIIGYLISNKTNAPATLPTIATLDASKKGNFYQTRATARNAGISTSAISYVAVGTAYNALASYLGNMTPIKPWDITDLNKDKNVTVVKDTFRQTWLNYYLAVQKLVEDTALQVKSQIDDHEDRITTVSAGFETLKDSIKLYATKDEVKNSLTAYPTKTEMDAQLNLKANEINLGIQTTITGLSSSDKNLLLKSNVPASNQSYMIKSYDMSELMVEGDDYVFRAKLTIGTGKSWVGIWLDGGLITLGAGRLTKDTDGTYYMKFKGKKGTNTARSIIQVYIGDGSVTGVTSSIEWAKLTKSNIMFKQWTPAPEDTDDSISSSLAESKTYTNTQIKLNTETINLGIKKVEESVTKVSDNLNNLQIGNRNYFSIKAWDRKPNLTASSVPYMDIKLEANTEYTLSTNIPIQTNGQYDVFLFKGTDAPSSNSNGVAKDRPRTLTTNADGILKVAMRSYSLSNGYWIMLAKGNKALDWQPAIEDDTLSTAWANDPEGKVDFTRTHPNENLLVRTGEIEKKIVDTSGNITNYLGNNTSSVLIPVKSGEVLYFSQSQPPTATSCFRWRWLDANQIYISRGADASNQKFTNTVPANASFLQVSYSSTWESKVERNSYSLIMPSPKDNAVKSQMAYVGYSPVSSDNPSDYVWLENPKAKGTFIAYSNSPNGTKDFTKPYPNENLLLGGRTIDTVSNNASIYPITNEILVEDNQSFRRTRRTSPTTNPTTFSIFTAIDIGGLVPNLLGKKVGLSVEARASSPVKMSLMAKYVGGASGNFAGDGRHDQISTEWSQIKLVIDSYPTGATTIRFNPLAIVQPVPDLSTFYLDLRNWKIEILEPSQTDATPYTTPPTEDPIKAEMAYIGYSSKDSDNPADYAWTENPRVKGTFKRWANSPDGKTDFTDRYPNENELLDSRSPKVQKYQESNIVIQEGVSVPEWGATDAVKHTISGGAHATVAGTIATGILVEAGVKYVHSIYVKNTGTQYVRINNNLSQAIDVLPGETKKVVFNPSGNATGAAAKQFVIYRANASVTQEFILWHAKIEKSDTTETIWTSSPNDDYLGSVPQYVGIGVKNSNNPADFTWNLSSEYNQAVTVTSVKEVELQLTPDSIYAKVSEAPDYIVWKELVDSKPSIDDLSNVYDQLEGLSSADETILASMAELEVANNGVLTSITQAIEGMDGTLSTITDYMFFGTSGLTIGKSDSPMKVNISNTELAFYDNSTKVAWVDSQRLNIREALIEKKIKVGNHIIEKFDDKEEITIFKYDGI